MIPAGPGHSADTLQHAHSLLDELFLKLNSVVITSTELGFDCLVSLIQVSSPCASYLTSLSLRSFFWKMGTFHFLPCRVVGELIKL